MACNAETLLEEGKCFDCLSWGAQGLVELQLLCNIYEAMSVVVPPTESDVTNLGDITGATALSLNLTQYYTATATGDITLSVTDRAESGKSRGFTIFLEAPAADRQVTIAAPGVPYFASPATQVTGKRMAITFTDTNGTALDVAMATVP